VARAPQVKAKEGHLEQSLFDQNAEPFRDQGQDEKGIAGAGMVGDDEWGVLPQIIEMILSVVLEMAP
jgi:hypothetical protein